MDFLFSTFLNIIKHLNYLLDIGIVFIIIYNLYKSILETTAVPIIRGFIVVSAFYVMAHILNLETLLWILEASMQSLLIVAFITIQPQISKILADLGNIVFFNSFNTNYKSIDLDQILESCEYLSKKRRGALIVFERENGLKSTIDSGVKIDSNITKELLNTIFEHNTQLHDGAVIIGKNSKIVAGSCVLPLSNRNDIKQTFGTRHRAAIGVTENNDCVALVVSEENGSISITYNAKIYYNLEKDEAKMQILEFIKPKEEKKKNKNERKN